jgi:hypothetical protein
MPKPAPAKFTPKKELATKIRAWQEVSIWLEEAKAQEMALRKEIADALYPSTTKGTKTFALTGWDGMVARVTRKVNVSIDEAELAVRAKTLVAMGVPLDKLISYSPKVVQKELDALPSAQAKHFALVLEIKPGAPSLDIS